MTLQMSRIFLTSVGPDPARYDPLDLRLTDIDRTGPCDSVFFLPNAGGKTVLLRLLFSVLHPPGVERIGSEEARRTHKNLHGYVLEGDTSHVVVEWRQAKQGVFTDDEVLLTGLVAEWRNQRPSKNPDDLMRRWYTVRGPAGTVSIESLPFDVVVADDPPPDDGAHDGNDGHVEQHTENESAQQPARPTRRRKLRLAAYSEALADLRRHRGVQVTTAEVQRKWMQHLDEQGLDSALFRYQAQMNQNEAGASAIARFTRDADFIQFFLDVVLDPAELETLDRQIDGVAAKAKAYPEYAKRLEFNEAVLRELEPLCERLEQLGAARTGAHAARSRAATVLSAFTGGLGAARLREAEFAKEVEQLGADRQRLVASTDKLRDEARAYARVAAAIALQQATDELEDKKRTTASLDLDLKAWAIMEEVVRLRTAQAEIDTLQIEFDEEQERTRPLRQARDDAATALRDRLTADIVVLELDERARQERVVQHRRTAEERTRDATTASAELARMDERRKSIDARLAEIDVEHAGLVARKILLDGERVPTAQTRHEGRKATAERAAGVAAEVLLVLEDERQKLDTADDEARDARIALTNQLKDVLGLITRLTNERNDLADDALVREAAEADVFSLDLIGAAIATRLLDRARIEEEKRLAIEVRSAEDRRAVRGLSATSLLPPPLETEQALRRLLDAGIVGVSAGTRYVSEAFGVDEREVVAMLYPELVGGIVVHNDADLDRCRSILDAAGLDPSAVIAVGAASSLATALRAGIGRPDRTFVIPPAPAVWDQAAGPAEQTKRESRLAGADAESAASQSAAQAARRLADRLTLHLREAPPGFLESRIAERGVLEGQVKLLDDARKRRGERRAEITTERNAAQQQEQLQLRAARAADGDLRELASFAARDATRAQLVADLGRLTADEISVAANRETAERLAKEARDAGDAEATAIVDARVAAGRARDERDAVHLAAAPRDVSEAEALQLRESDVSLDEFRTRFRELDLRYAGETSEHEINAKLAVAIRTRDETVRVLNTHSPAERVRATELADPPESARAEGRAAARRRSETAHNLAKEAEQHASNTEDRCKQHLKAVDQEIKSSRRSAKLESVPTTKEAALRLEAEARLAADEMQAQVAANDRRSQDAESAANEQSSLASALATLASQLRMALRLAPDATLPSAAAFTAAAPAANELGEETARALHAALEIEEGAENAWLAQDARVRELLQLEAFAPLITQGNKLALRLASSPPEVLASSATDLRAELQSSTTVLRGELASMSADVKLATEGLAKTVNKSLSALRTAEARSKMPDSLRGWAAHPFLTIRFDKPASDEVETRLAPFVSEIIATAKRPMGTALVMQAIERAVGTFAVQILKPNEAFQPLRVSITELSSQTFSNGQRSTVATALMLMLAELRRSSRASNKSAFLGTLVLDNPFGNANASFLIDLQRTVAAAADIQLVYTTGIADMNTLRHFSNVVALSNDAAKRTMRRWVRARPELLQSLIPQTAPPGGRLTSSRVLARPKA